MQRKRISGTDLESSSFCLGGVALGSKLNLVESFKMLDKFVERGGNMIDTAQVYANWLPIERSVSEKTIGKWMKERQNRNQMIVTTKGAHPHLETMHIPRLSKEEIVQDLEDSLQRLQVDAIDLYWLHRDDPKRPIGEILETLNAQVSAGKIRYFGCSNWSTERIKEAKQYAECHGLQGFSANQMMWNLAAINRMKLIDPTLVTMDGAMKQYHHATGLTAFPYSSQAQGLFVKWENGTHSFDDRRISPCYRSAENRNRFERVRQLASEFSLTVSQVVLGYLLSQSFPTIPIIGCHTPEQLDESLEAANIRLSQGQLDYLEKGI